MLSFEDMFGPEIEEPAPGTGKYGFVTASGRVLELVDRSVEFFNSTAGLWCYPTVPEERGQWDTDATDEVDYILAFEVD